MKYEVRQQMKAQVEFLESRGGISPSLRRAYAEMHRSLHWRHRLDRQDKRADLWMGLGLSLLTTSVGVVVYLRYGSTAGWALVLGCAGLLVYLTAWWYEIRYGWREWTLEDGHCSCGGEYRFFRDPAIDGGEGPEVQPGYYKCLKCRRKVSVLPHYRAGAVAEIQRRHPEWFP